MRKAASKLTKKKTAGKAKKAGKPKAKAPSNNGQDKWNTREVTVVFRGKALKGKIGIAVPGLDAPSNEKFLELASLCAQHAARSQGVPPV
ncbi:MAG: hypothetical protein HY042_06465 [Spirochaetia bacterium]|nr:hypothetical protein [Spirochaetia bacterium]